MAMKTALYPGSFSPFTVGHASVVRRVAPLFDRVVIAVGDNRGKVCVPSAVERAAAIARLYEGDARIEVTTYEGLTADYALAVGASCIVKGVRSCGDYESELVQADVNRRLTGIETLLVPAEPHLSHVSSSLVRELAAFGRDVSVLLPTAKRAEEEGTL